MSSEVEKRNRPSPTSIVALVIILLAAYALAPAPIEKYGLEQGAVGRVYYAAVAPLSWMYERIPVVEECYDWYFALWPDQ